MRVGIAGAGGVGGYFGARLVAAGVPVAFLARGAHAEAMRQRGLRVESPEGDLAVDNLTVDDDPARLGPVDVLVVAVKTWQLADLAPRLAPMAGPDTMVVPLLNGVEAADRLAEVFGWEHVLKGLTRIISFIGEPGVIRHVGAVPHITFGEPDNRRSARADALLGVLTDAGISAEIPKDVDAALWEKLMFVVSTGGLGAVTRAPIGVVRSQPETRVLLRRAMEEVVAVAQGRGVGLPTGAAGKGMDFIDTLPPEATTSLQRDLAAGRRSELDAWTGAVVRLGDAADVDTPVHRFIYDTMLPLERRARGEVAFPGAD